MKYNNILIQGAMDIEVEYLIDKLEKIEKIIIYGYDFYKGYIDNKCVTVSKTLMGTINSTIATLIGINTFKPDIVINQGIAGSHKRNIHVGDVIIGEKCCNINSYSMPTKEKGEGSDPFKWKENKRDKEVKLAHKVLVDKAKEQLGKLSKNNVFIGTIGSGDVFNREIDRIDWISDNFKTACEEMESIGVYTVCNSLKVPCVGVRVISNNELNKEIFDETQAIILQKLIFQFIREI